MREGNADAVDAAVGGGEDFDAETVFFDDLATHRDMSGDFGDEATESGGLIMFRQAQCGGVVGVPLG